MGKTSAFVALFSEIAFVLLFTVLAGILAGYWIDQRLGTTPIFVLIGFVTTPVIAVAWLILRIMAAVAASKGENYTYPLTIRLVK